MNEQMMESPPSPSRRSAPSWSTYHCLHDQDCHVGLGRLWPAQRALIERLRESRNRACSPLRKPGTLVWGCVCPEEGTSFFLLALRCSRASSNAVAAQILTFLGLEGTCPCCFSSTFPWSGAEEALQLPCTTFQGAWQLF